MQFKKGDTIIMLEDCLPSPLKGEKLEVKVSSYGSLHVESSDSHICTCQYKWKLTTKDWDNLAVDDVLVDECGDKRWVLGTCGRVIFLSFINNKDGCGSSYIKEELIKFGYTILQDEEPIPETIEISGVKYNKQVVDDFLKSIK